MKKFGVIAILCLLLTGLAACGGGGGNVEEFTAKIAGTWYQNANLLDDKLTVLEDGSWTCEDPEEEFAEEGTINYNEEHKTFQFVIGNTMYPVTLTEGDTEILYYIDNFYREQDSVSGYEEYDGSWYLNGDANGSYFVIFDGQWAYYEDDVNVSNAGYVEWNNAAGKLLLRVLPEEDPFAELDAATTELTSGGDTYILAEGAAEEDYNEGGNVVIVEGGPVFDRYYYMEGDSEGEEGSLYFYDDGTVDFDSPGQPTAEGIWAYDGTELLISVMDEQQRYTVEEGGNVLVLPDGSRIIVEGASNGAEETVDSANAGGSLVFGEYYYYDGDVNDISWIFNDTGTAVYDDTSGFVFEGAFEVTDSGEINVYDSTGENIYVTLTIEGEYTIVDTDNGDTYMLSEE
jgi:hypothetical protein